MTYVVKTAFSLFLPGLLFFNSCNGQTKSQPGNVSSDSTLLSGHPKIVKTQGSNAWQNISCGLEDHAGNLWFGTSGEGVYRYDGKLFTQFSVQNGLNSNVVGSILEDRNKNIWVGTKNGLCRFDGKKMQPISMQPGASFRSLTSGNINSDNQVFCIMQDRKGTLWLGTANGVFCYDGKNFFYFLGDRTVVNDSNITLKSVQCIFEDSKGNIWFGSGPMAFEGLCLFNGKALTRIALKKENWIRKITEGRDGKILLTSRHIGVFTGAGTSFLPVPGPPELNNDLLTCILEDSQGNTWYASDYLSVRDITSGGIWKYDKKTFTHFTKQDGFRNTSASFLLEDSKKNVWIGTRNTGLYCFNGEGFTSFYE